MVKQFICDDAGASTMEVSIITVALIVMALAFKEQIIEMTKAIAAKILG